MMRLRTQLFILAAVISMTCYLGGRSGESFRRELIFESGAATVVDEVWKQAALTWTLQGSVILAYSSPTISQINPIDTPVVRRGMAQLEARLWRLRWRAFMGINTHRPLGRNWPPRQLDYLLAGAGGALCLMALTLMGRLARRKKRGFIPANGPKTPEASQAGGRPAIEDLPGAFPTAGAAETPQEQVVAFFLQLFQAQVAPGRQAKVGYRASGAKGTHGTAIYDLQVRVQGKVHRRRMSIGPLGPGRVGASLCFFVIYDVHLVVKLPRTPITDYGQYIEAIDKERQIASLLGDLPVIVPRVTTILENVHRFGDHETLSGNEVEQRYIGWMRRNTAFQRYLKVGESFAFFMALSSHHFLRHVLNEMHLNRDRILEEIRDYGHLIWKPHEFIGRYGAAAQPVCAQLQGVYQNCRRSLDLPTHPAKTRPQVTDYQRRKDFLAGVSDHLAPGSAPSAPRQVEGATDMRHDDMRHDTMCRLVGEQTGVLKHYRRTMTRYLRRTLFLNHRKQIGVLVANTLHLVTTLNDRRIALRDLKPENLLVVGRGDNFPDFLKRRRDFRLGLIDLETATARCGEGEGEDLLSAPRPGGTPLYATPSHFLGFDALERIYREPFEILMAQDWYAAIAICFRTVTGEHLWDGTAGLFPAMVEMMAGADCADPDGFGSFYSKLSWVFWSNARMEFRDKLHKHRPSLSQVRVDLAPECAEAIRARIDRRILGLNEEAKALMGAHEKLGEVVHHLQLTDATSEQIRLLRTTWEMDATDDSKRAYLLSDRFRELEGMTQNLEALSQGRELFENPADGIDMIPLLTVLFAHCLSLMYKGSWKGLGHRRIDWHEALMDEPSYTQTL